MAVILVILKELIPPLAIFAAITMIFLRPPAPTKQSVVEPSIKKTANTTGKRPSTSTKGPSVSSARDSIHQIGHSAVLHLANGHILSCQILQIKNSSIVIGWGGGTAEFLKKEISLIQWGKKIDTPAMQKLSKHWPIIKKVVNRISKKGNFGETPLFRWYRRR